MTKIKICGITNIEDALAAAAFGADMLGLNFYSKSPRYLALRDAAAIAARIPERVLKVGIFVDSAAEEVSDIAEEVGLDVIQLHGDEDNIYIREIGLITEKPIIKAFRMSADTSIAEILSSDADAVLLDAASNGAFGGTGETFDWDLVSGISSNKQVFLAGGLTDANVVEAIRLVRPYAVDVASGVESAPGKKDLYKVEAFIRNAKVHD